MRILTKQPGFFDILGACITGAIIGAMIAVAILGGF